jgi:Ser/Thr protein kinase RdoA (MazF antagonist)
MRKDERVAIATLWTMAMSKKGATPLRAVADVLDDDVRTSNLAGKEAVLEWFRTWPGMSMFRTGTWTEPVVSGDVVTFVCDFNPKAAYHAARVAITVAATGRITHAMATIHAAPDPLGSVINRVWGPRIGIDRLGPHLEATYGVTVKKIAPLQQGNHGVHRVDLAKGGPWVVRVFPADRPVADVEGDASALRYLESAGFPAERCVADVSVHEGQGVLVTGFVKGTSPKPSTAIERAIAGLVGRSHAMTDLPKAAKRGAGGLHLYTVDGTVRTEIETAKACLEAAAFRGTDDRWELLRAGLDAADDFASLPKAFMHPDPGTPNAVISGRDPIFIDWTGAGLGPRVLGLGLLLGACADGKTFNREWTDAMMNAYAEHVRLKPSEFEHLEAAIAHRWLIHEVYAWGLGMATQRKPGTFRSWPQNNEGIAKMAAYIRERWS